MKKTLAMAAVLGVIALVGLLPSLILGKTTRYEVVSPQVVSYRSSVRCEGSVYPKEGYDLMVSQVYLISQRYVSLGEEVEKGQVLAELTRGDLDPVFYYQTQGRGLSGMEEEGLSSLMESYGLASAAGGGGYSAIQALVEGEEDEEDKVIQITAPVKGIVTKEIPTPGSVVKAGATICSVEGTEEYFALLSIGEKDAAKLSEGNEVVLTGEGVGLLPCAGVVTKIYPGTRKELSGTTTQNVVDIEVSILSEHQEIRSGFSVKAQIFTEDERQVMVLPYESVQQDQENQEYVLVAGEYHLEKRPISTGVEMIDGVEVLEGVEPGELVTVPKNEIAASDGPQRYLLERG